MAIYKGFSTRNRYKKFRLTDFELAKQDLLNHFYIRKGEKLMNPNFGSLIWNTIFEPLTDSVRDKIIRDINDIAKYDPRIAVNNVTVQQYEHGLIVDLDLTYIPTSQVEKMFLQFDQRQGLSSGLR